MAEQDMKLDLIISATDLASKEIASIRQQLNGLTSSTKGVGKASDSIFGGMKIGWAAVATAVVGATMAVKQFASEAIDVSISYESAFAGVRKTIDATEEEFNNLSDAYKRMSEEIPATYEELSKIGELGGQLGVGVNDIENFTSTIAKLGASVDSLGMEEAAMSLAQFANVTKVGNGNIDRLASTIVQLGNNSATTEAEIMNFSSRLQGAGANAGISASAIMGIATTFASAGVEAEAGGTAVSKVINQMKSAAVAGGKNLDKFAKAVGMTTKEFQNLMNTNPDKALVKFMKALNGAGDEAQIMLSNLGLNDVRLTSAFLSAAQNADQLENYINMANQAYEENIALTEEAEKRFATTESQITMAQNERSNMMAELGDKIKPLILLRENVKTAALGFFAEVVTPIADFIESLNLSGESGRAMILTIQSAFQSFKDWAVETFGPLFESLQAFRDEHGEKVKMVLGAIGEVFKGALSVAGSLFQTMIDNISAGIDLVTALFKGDWDGAIQAVEKIFSGMKDYFKSILDTILGFFGTSFDEVYNTVTGAVDSAIEAIKTTLQKAVDRIDDTFFSPIRRMIDGLRDAWNSLLSLFGGSSTGQAVQQANHNASSLLAKKEASLRAAQTDGARAEGGPVYSGSSYLVGERGPELFVPQTSGTIVPNDEITKQGDINITISGTQVNSQSDIDSLVDTLIRKIKLERNFGIA